MVTWLLSVFRNINNVLMAFWYIHIYACLWLFLRDKFLEAELLGQRFCWFQKPLVPWVLGKFLSRRVIWEKSFFPLLLITFNFFVEDDPWGPCPAYTRFLRMIQGPLSLMKRDSLLHDPATHVPLSLLPIPGQDLWGLRVGQCLAGAEVTEKWGWDRGEWGMCLLNRTPQPLDKISKLQGCNVQHREYSQYFKIIL